MNINGIAHIALNVSDLKKSKLFYDKILTDMGLTLIHSSNKSFYYVGGKTGILIQQANADKIKNLKLEHNEIIIDENNNNKFVYSKAIRIKDVCLNCHGSDINDDLKKEIQKLYPYDKAINYKLNDVRGAFVMYRYIKN